MQVNYKRELDRLRTVEYGDVIEFPARMAGVSLGSIALYIYTGWWSALLWGGFFLISHAISYVFLHKERRDPKARDLNIAGVLFLFVFVAFLWMPVVMAVQEDRALSFAGSTLLASLLVFIVRRSDTLLWMALGQIALMGVAFLVILLHVLAGLEHWTAQVGAVGVALTVQTYLTIAVLAARAMRIRIDEQADKSAHEQQLAAIGRLSSGLAHDFNNMLTAVLGNLELSRLAKTNHEKEMLISEAETAARRAETLIQQLVIYTRSSQGVNRQQDVSHAMQRMMMLARRLAPRDTSISLHIAEQPMTIEVDPAQLLTALVHLVSNAVDAIPDRGRVRVSTLMERFDHPVTAADGDVVKPGVYAAIRVEDNGPGIPDRDLPLVVEPFFTTKSTNHTAGLGLPMVVNFARQAQGALLLHSGSAGLTATLLLPLTQQSEQEATPYKPIEQPEKEEAAAEVA